MGSGVSESMSESLSVDKTRQVKFEGTDTIAPGLIGVSFAISNIR
jgi:hypothetical protein